MGCHRANVEWMLRTGSLFEHPRLTESIWWQQWQCSDLTQVEKALTISRGALGHAYESYWQALVSEHPSYKIRYANQQIFQQKRTMGELDLIVEDSQGMIEHWELACKFYMLVGGQPNNPHHWLGPNTRDSLGIKMQRLLQQQLALTQTPACIEWLHSVGIETKLVRTQGIVQGRLFVPIQMAIPKSIDFELGGAANFSVADQHLGHWGAVHQLAQTAFTDCTWQPLTKIEWLSGVASDPSPINSMELVELVTERQSPVMCRMLESQQVYFWVPESWLSQADHRIATDNNQSPDKA